MITLPQFDFELSSEQIEILEKHLNFVLEYNKKVQLTSIRDFDEGVLLHVVDSLMGLESLNDLKPGRVLDMGSGGGFPGIPLAVASDRKVDLLDSVKKKMKGIDLFLVTERLQESVATIDIRAEELALKHPERYSVVIARALSSLPSLLELASPLLSKGGSLLAYKGDPSEEELARAEKVARMVGMKLDRRKDYYLPGTDIKRTLISYAKVANSKTKLPRRNGMAQRSPLA